MDCLSQIVLLIRFLSCILKQMKETFETNLSSSQKEEMANQKAYEELKAAKDWVLVSESDNRAPDCPIVRFAGVCTKSDVVNLVFELDAR